MELLPEAEVEAGVVDEKRERGRVALHLLEDGAEDTAKVAHVAQHLEQSHHRQVPHVRQQVCAFGGQTVPSEPEDGEARDSRTEVPDQLTGVEVAGGLAAGDEKSRSGRGGHAGAV